MKLTTPFETSKLDQIIRDRYEQNERERQKLLQKVVEWLDEHGLQYGIQTAYIFGSLTQPQRFHQNSDIYIAVEQINPDDFFAVIGFISETMGRDVDVIELYKCHFGDRIRQTGIPWTAINSSF
ncbi:MULTISPECIES: nucleotidyltransferase family protein [Planktothrix]|uniref:DNA polymerase beta domain protein n=2 Tax=Planktothrix TaxID=54304 RepID=A0A4P6A1R0_PLAAG|nr:MULTISPECIES: nucleotidyltransferase domain-containing protein [Planktothrix]CAD5911974.1 Signal peptidase II [Planktothrix rubescens]CAC5345695.1 putative nucleotidyltransferase [Planktothrix rubescens NIVA-CYA 18]CAD0231755.1 Signal peptidase II [Planktothrix agardhii]CAD5955009.1 Signal peptidase II [Planktothrix rubescens NIVA-CYA 18]GDZ95931.1 DNA polymerase beta domain protein [Planktothrix agardhii CCAP 1459/11A]